jgi:DNA-directed RNA polymerase specialized sigma24 family protein
MLLIDTHTPRARKLEAAAASSSRRMTVEEETRLAKRSLKGGRTGADARNKLVMANYGLIHMVAGAYRRAGVRYEDLVQEGAMGLMRAAETFDPTRGVRFGTYAVYWIRSKVQRFIEAQRRESNPLMAGVDAVDHADGKRHIPRGSTLSLEAPLDAAADRTVADPATIVAAARRAKAQTRCMSIARRMLGLYVSVARAWNSPASAIHCARSRVCGKAPSFNTWTRHWRRFDSTSRNSRSPRSAISSATWSMSTRVPTRAGANSRNADAWYCVQA